MTCLPVQDRVRCLVIIFLIMEVCTLAYQVILAQLILFLNVFILLFIAQIGPAQVPEACRGQFCLQSQRTLG